MTQLDVAIHGPAAYAQLALGLVAWLLPGWLLSRRILPAAKYAWILAPILSTTMFVLALFALNVMLGIPFNVETTYILSGVLTIVLAPSWRRVVALVRRKWRTFMQGPRSSLRWYPKPATAWLLFAAIGFVALLQATPHIPGDDPESYWAVYPELASRADDGLRGEDYPYPIHVDEHIHFARMAEMVRTENVEIANPYTGSDATKDLASVSGFRLERGMDIAILTIHYLTQVPLAALFRFLPAVWAAELAAVVWLALRPAPGALPAAALVSMLPSTPRFLGPSFLISSNFALPWIFAVLLVVLRAQGAARFFGVMLLIAGAFFLHLVLGTICLSVALLGILARTGDWRDRFSVLLASLLPLVWVVPGIWSDLQDAIEIENPLPFQPEFLASSGPIVAVLAVAGAALCFWRPTENNTPHRVLAFLALGLTALLYGSIVLDHHSDATYSRLVFAFFLCLAGLAGYGLSKMTLFGLKKLDWHRFDRWRARMKLAIPTIALILILPTAVTGNLSDEYYRVHNDASWAQAQAFAEHAEPGDVFLSHPWRAALFNAGSGAYPHTVLYPGAAPENQADYIFYGRTGGNEAWFEERGIEWVLTEGRAPAVPFDEVAPGVYRILS